jgi:hypothetical protein
MRQFWTGALKRRFTFSAVDGVGKSTAFRFCMAAIIPLDASVDESEMQTAVRLERSSSQHSQGSKTGKKAL